MVFNIEGFDHTIPNKLSAQILHHRGRERVFGFAFARLLNGFLQLLYSRAHASIISKRSQTVQIRSERSTRWAPQRIRAAQGLIPNLGPLTSEFPASQLRKGARHGESVLRRTWLPRSFTLSTIHFSRHSSQVTRHFFDQHFRFQLL